MINYLVTGGAGFVGSKLIQKLLESNKNKIIIFSLDNYSSGSRENHIVSKNIKYYKGHTKNISKIFNNKKIDLVFHFGEFSRVYQSFSNKDICIQSNIIGTINVINFCLKKKIPIFYSGSSSIFGNNFKDENLSPYSWTKSKGIEMIKNYSKWFGLKYIITYFYNVYGPGQITEGNMAAVVGKFENLYKKNKPLTIVKPGTYKRDFTHIDDIVNCCILALKRKKFNEEYRLGNGKLISIIELAKLFKSKIKFISERKGERMGVSAKIANGFKKLNYKPKNNIKNYIKKIINKN
jgi:UDP-glucose 4-epimerase